MITGRGPKSPASLPNRIPPAPHPNIATMYGTVANERDTANSCSMGGRNRLNVFMLIEVIVAAAVHSNKIEFREKFITMTMPAS